MADKMVKVNLPKARPIRMNPEDREAIMVGPGLVEVPEWAAKAWKIEPVQGTQPKKKAAEKATDS